MNDEVKGLLLASGIGFVGLSLWVVLLWWLKQ